jgi:predicted peptidase
VGIKTIGFMAADGAKLAAIAVEHDVDLTGANVGADTYTIWQYQAAQDANYVNFGDGEIGDITKIYVNDKPEISASGGTGTSTGKYVIIEVYTDYQYGSEVSVLRALSASVTQKKAITAGNTTVAASETEFNNYTMTTVTDWGITTEVASVNPGAYVINGIEGFKYYTHVTNDINFPVVDGPTFVAERCFNEQSGQYETVNQSYALFVPADYQQQVAAGKKFAFVTVDHPADSVTTHPMAKVLQSRGPSYFISDEAQQIVKDTHGLGGLIVVVPVVTARVNDNAGTPAGFPSLVKLWDKLIDKYEIDENYVYGAGQSVGGMVLLETNTKRDNYFAGILLYDNQWAQNYYKDEVFARGMMADGWNDTDPNTPTPRHYPSTDASLIWNYHWGDNGEKVYAGHDPFNFYYLTSDDNIMITNSTANALSVNTWVEQNHVYKDLTGYEMPKLLIPDFTVSKAVQNQAIKNYLATSNQKGLWWVTFTGGSSQTTPIWSRSLNATYEWLLTQTRQTEMARSKLDLNKPFEAVVQETRVVPGFTAPDGSGDPIYYKTGKAGSGAQFYNTSWLNLGNRADQIPGWLPGSMTHPVAAASIENVTAIRDNNGKLTAVAIKYSVNMAGAVIHMVGDNVIGSRGQTRDDKVTMDTYDFYDTSLAKISATITNIYANNSPGVVLGAARGSGAGQYVIVEINTPSDAQFVHVAQRATVRTNTAIASASSTIY